MLQVWLSREGSTCMRHGRLVQHVDRGLGLPCLYQKSNEEDIENSCLGCPDSLTNERSTPGSVPSHTDNQVCI